jgi:phosphopantetheinyl transferase (holo-ACP synthase)
MKTDHRWLSRDELRIIENIDRSEHITRRYALKEGALKSKRARGPSTW